MWYNRDGYNCFIFLGDCFIWEYEDRFGMVSLRYEKKLMCE